MGAAGGLQGVKLFDAAGVELSVLDGVAIPANTSSLLVAGKDGSTARTFAVDAQGRMVVAPTGGTASVKGFSFGSLVQAATTISPIRSTAYTEQTANAQRSIASADANDDGSPVGTGARTVRLTYYTVTGAGPFTEDITLNGTAFVNTVNTDICFIERIEVLTVGSTGSNVGILTLKAGTGGGGATIWTVAALANRTFGAHHYVALSKVCNITGVVFGIKGADTTTGFLRAKSLGADQVDKQVSDFIRVPANAQSTRSYGTPVQVSGPARVTAMAAPDSSSSRTYYGSFDFFEE